MTLLPGLAAYGLATLTLAAGLTALALSTIGWRARHDPLDLACAFVTACLLSYLLTRALRGVGTDTPLTVFASHAALQLAIGAVSFFLLLGASVTHFEVHVVWMLQSLLGLLLLAWFAWGPLQPRLAFSLWVVLNLLATAGLSFAIGWQAFKVRTARPWVVFGISVMGVIVSAQDLLPLSGPWLHTTLPRFVFVAFLLGLWLALTDRQLLELRGGGDSDNPDTTVWMSITSGIFLPTARATQAAVADERRRIAHDLHDGVGSQLVNLLASLNPASPGDRKMALALEQCLVDLKITVDNIDSNNDSVLDALGRLRYRIQPLLDRLGIGMSWHVDVDGPLQEIRGERAKHIVRIAQECLSNCMRHANATQVTLTCEYVVDTDSLHFEFSDNGQGMPMLVHGHSTGKGLEYMYWRAGKLGGRLYMTTRPGGGVRVRVLAPLRSASDSE